MRIIPKKSEPPCCDIITPVNRIFLSSAYVPFVAWGLLVLFFVLPSRVRLPMKILLAAFFLVALSMFRGFARFGTSIWRPELPETLIWTWSVCFFGSLLLAIASIPSFFARYRFVRPVLAALCFGIAATGVWNGIRIPAVRRIEIRDPRLPSDLDGYRIVQISDIHACGAARRWRTEGIVRRANTLAADLVCLTGDQSDGTVAQRLSDVAPLQELRARDGVFAVTGNHEHFYDIDEWRPVYRRLGVRLLENESVHPHASLALGGVNAFNASGTAAPDVGRAFAAATNGEYRILLQHRPNPADENFSVHRVSLQLSGHTHGGFMPILAPLVRNSHGGFLRGVYPIGNGHLVVSAGCGPWPALPLRYFDPAEILLITLTRWQGAGSRGD